MYNNIFKFNRLAGDEKQQDIMANALVVALRRALYARAFVNQMVDGKEFVDHNNDTLGRKCFRAGVVALWEGNVADAFWWYHRGATEFSDSTTILHCDNRNDELHNLAVASKYTYVGDYEYYEWEITACCYVTSPWGVTAADYKIGSMVSKPEKPSMTFWYTESQFHKTIEQRQRAESIEKELDFTYDDED